MDSTVTSQAPTLRLSAATCEIPRPRPRSAGVGRRCKGSMLQRCTNLEDNIVRNLEIMREHRMATTHIREKRKDDAEKQAARISQEAGAITESGLLPWDSAPEERELGSGSMRERCAALEEHLQRNDETMRGHRTFLDDAHVAKRNATARMSAVTVDVEDEHPAPPRPSSAPRVAVAWRPPSASQRPLSAGALGGLNPRSAGSSHLQRPESGATERTRPASASSSTPCSGLYSWAGSRPPSAGSMRARTRALEENMQKNKVAHAENRRDFNIIMKERNDKQKKVVDEMMGDLRRASAASNLVV